MLSYAVRPALWVLVLVTVRYLPSQRPRCNMRLSREMTGAAILMALAQVTCSVLLGLLEGFGKSPYSFSLVGVLVNLWVLSAEILGMELSRAWLVNRLARRSKSYFALLVGLAYVPLDVSLGRLRGLGGKLELVRFIGRDLLPGISQNVACAVLSFMAGPLPAIAYRGLLSAFWWFCPIIPHLSWEMTAVVNTVVPVVGVSMAWAEHMGVARQRRRRKDAVRDVRTVLCVAVTGMCLLWFAAGLFPVYPSVVVSGSMLPTIRPGDMILATKRVVRVQPGDIIEFRRDDLWAAHRVVAIERTADAELYVTKGDANATNDKDPVLPYMVRGKVVAVLPRIGKVTLAIKRLVHLWFKGDSCAQVR